MSAHVFEEYNFLSLLPYTENSQLINKQQKLSDLYFAKSVIDFAIVALKTFLGGDLVAFDAQVGENLCQIRAYKILHLAKKWLYASGLMKEFYTQLKTFKIIQLKLDSTIAEWEQAIKQSKAYDKNLDAVEKVTFFFERHQLCFDINEDFVFLILCQFLTHFNIKDNNIPVAIDLNKIATEFSISKYRAKRLVHVYQQMVCKIGCHFIIQIANELDHKLVYCDLLPLLIKIADEDRQVLPCFFVSEIIFKHAIQEKIPILFTIKRFIGERKDPYDVLYFFFLRGKSNKEEVTLVPCKEFLNNHCIVVSGVVYDNFINDMNSSLDYINNVLMISPLKLILANTAIHPQYSGKKLESYRDNPFQTILLKNNQPVIDLEEMKNFASYNGCSKQNPSTFFLKHVYASKLINEINKLKSHYTGCAYLVAQSKYVQLSSIGLLYDRKKPGNIKSI
ncbi:MAG: hypothetical protein H0U57_14015 [Tatlockia sp.]|nr:hypothetical protein [Tatlockia sp.]